MTQEPTTNPVNEDDNEPATKGELRQLEQSTDVRFDAVLKLIKEEGEKTRQQMDDVNKRIDDQAKKTRQHFDVVAENIHRDVASANRDEISLIKDQQLPDHEQRLQRLEKKAGLPIPSSAS